MTKSSSCSKNIHSCAEIRIILSQEEILIFILKSSWSEKNVLVSRKIFFNVDFQNDGEIFNGEQLLMNLWV